MPRFAYVPEVATDLPEGDPVTDTMNLADPSSFDDQPEPDEPPVQAPELAAPIDISRFPKLEPQGSAEAAPVAQPIAPVPWDDIAGSDIFKQADRDTQLDVLDKWGAHIKQQLDGSDDPARGHAAVDAFISKQQEAISPAYAGAHALQQTVHQLNQDGLLTGSLTPLSPEQEGELAQPMNQSQILNYAGQPDVFQEAIARPSDAPKNSGFLPSFAAETASGVGNALASIVDLNPTEETSTAYRARIGRDIALNQGVIEQADQRASRAVELAGPDFYPGDLRQQKEDAQKRIAKLQADLDEQTKPGALYDPADDARKQGFNAKNKESLASSLRDLANEGVWDFYGADPRSTNLSAQVGRGAGSVATIAPTMGMGGLGLPIAVAQMSGAAYERTYHTKEQELRAAGVSDDGDVATQATQAAREAASSATTGLALYMGAGKIAAIGAGALLAESASPFIRGLAGFAGAEVANVGTSSVLRALEAKPGERLHAAIPTAESLTADTLFAVIHGVGEYKSAPPEARQRAATEAKDRGFSEEQVQQPPPADTAPAQALVSPDSPEADNAVPIQQVLPKEQLAPYQRMLALSEERINLLRDFKNAPTEGQLDKLRDLNDQTKAAAAEMHSASEGPFLIQEPFEQAVPVAAEGFDSERQPATAYTPPDRPEASASQIPTSASASAWQRALAEEARQTAQPSSRSQESADAEQDRQWALGDGRTAEFEVLPPEKVQPAPVAPQRVEETFSSKKEADAFVAANQDRWASHLVMENLRGGPVRVSYRLKEAPRPVGEPALAPESQPANPSRLPVSEEVTQVGGAEGEKGAAISDTPANPSARTGSSIQPLSETLARRGEDQSSSGNTEYTPYEQGVNLRRSKGDDAAAASVGITPEGVQDFYNGTNESGLNPNRYGQDGLSIAIGERLATEGTSTSTTPPATSEAPTPTAEASPATTEQAQASGEGISGDQQAQLGSVVDRVSKQFNWRNDAERDSAVAEATTKVEAKARKWMTYKGTLDGFSPSVVARSELTDVVRRHDTTNVRNIEPVVNEEGDALPSWTEATKESDQPDAQAAVSDAMSKVSAAMERLSDEGEKASDKRAVIAGVSAGETPTDIARSLGWTTGKTDKPDVTRVARAIKRAFDEILEDTKLRREDVFGLMPPGFVQMMKATEKGAAFLKDLITSVSSLKPFTDFRRTLLNWSARQQQSANEIMQMMHYVQKAVPKAADREGITNWIQANGDAALLTQRRDGSKNPALRKGYEAALNLSPESVKLAQHIKGVYDQLLARGQQYGLLTNGLSDYVNQIWEDPTANTVANAARKLFSPSSSNRLSDYFRFNRERLHASFFDGEQAGLKPVTKDISKLLGIYLNEMNNAIASKQMVLEMRGGKASDGRPLVSPNGYAQQIGDVPGEQSVLIYPDRLPENIEDYKVIANQPALHGWKWAATNENGKPTLFQADLAVHPEAYDHLNRVLSGSILSNWWNSESRDPLHKIGKGVTRFLLKDVQQIAKQTMLGFFSPFHAVQEATHAGFHRVNPLFNLPKIDLSNPAQMDAAQHGLMLAPDRVSQEIFAEGLSGGSKNIAVELARRIPGIGPVIGKWSDGFQQWLFHDYIPQLKFKTYEHIRERNMDRYKDELASGKATEDEVKYLSSQQTNAAYGHLNYTDLGRSAFIRQVSSALLLAPDFLEARGKFTAQAIKGALGTKVGREQFSAMLWGAGALWFGARILNKLTDDDWHVGEGFDVISGNRRYTVRSVPEDIMHAITDTRKFVSGRVSPLVKLEMEARSGVNYRGEKITGYEALRNFVASMVPLTLQPFARGASETTKNNPVTKWEQLAGALGLHVARYSPLTKVYPLAHDWQKANAGKVDGVKPPDNAVYAPSKYQQLRYALEDSDFERAAREFDKLNKPEGSELQVKPYKIRDGFRESLDHPFTGSDKTDRKFRASLGEKDRALYDAAVARRKVIWQRFIQLRKGMSQPAPE